MRTDKRLSAATHMIRTRHETNPRLLFRMGRTSDICNPYRAR
jgi:hypothetical protein